MGTKITLPPAFFRSTSMTYPRFDPKIPRNFGLGVRLNRHLPTTSHKSNPLPHRSRFASCHVSGVHGAPPTGANHIPLSTLCKYRYLEYIHKLYFINYRTVLLLGVPPRYTQARTHGAACASAREADGKGKFVQMPKIQSSNSRPTVPGGRIRALPAAARLPAPLRGRRPRIEVRPAIAHAVPTHSAYGFRRDWHFHSRLRAANEGSPAFSGTDSRQARR